MTEVSTPVEQEAPAPPPRRSRRRVVVTAVLTIAVLGLAFALFRFEAGHRPIAADAGDSMAPDFDLPTLTGGRVRLSDLRGQPIVLNFWASWCGPCKEEAPVLAAGHRKWEPQGVVFLGVDIKDSRRWAIEFQDTHGIKYPSAFDATGIVEKKYNVAGIPETFFIGRDGRIAAKWVGPIGEKTLDRYVTLILGTAPAPGR